MVVPIVLGLPAMILPVPPLMVCTPTPFPLGVQIAPPVFRLAAVLAIVMNRSVQSRFRLFNGVLAVGAVVGMRSRRSGEKQKRSHHQSCRCVVSKSSNHVNLLSDFHQAFGFYGQPSSDFDTVLPVCRRSQRKRNVAHSDL
jgi:hypothetical protein